MGSFGQAGLHGTGGGGSRGAERPSRNVARAASAEMTAKKPKPKLKDVWPEVKKLVAPRRWLLLGSFGIMIVNRMSGLVLPASTKYLIDNVMKRHEMNLLLPIVGAVVGATILQGVTSYALTQLLSKADSG